MVNNATRTTPAELEIKVRRPRFDFTQVPRHWFGGSAFASHMSNGVSLLFPAGEAFFVRSVRRYVDRYEGQPERLAEIRAFCQQEHQHSMQHGKHIEVLKTQGYDVDGFMRSFEKMLTIAEPYLPPNIALAGTAAAEHFTAMMSEGPLSETFLDDYAHPIMRDLIKWHAAEEIEHKAVAFDVLQDVDPRYSTRVIGLALATVVVFGAWAVATSMLLKQDGIARDQIRRESGEQRSLRGAGVADGVVLPGILAYLRRDFHPWQNQNLHLVERWREQSADGLRPSALN